MRILLVRHARAGRKRDWRGPDDRRPLDPTGAKHARRLVPMAREVPMTRLISSPTLRCRQTLEPLAIELARPILDAEALGPEASPDHLLAMLEDPAFDGAVLCTHGEVLRPVLEALVRRGLRRPGGRVDRSRLLTKGSAWDLELEDGRATAFRHLDPTRW